MGIGMTYAIIDTTGNRQVGNRRYQTRRAAIRAADQLNQQYGAHRYQPVTMTEPTSVGPRDGALRDHDQPRDEAGSTPLTPSTQSTEEY